MRLVAAGLLGFLSLQHGTLWASSFEQESMAVERCAARASEAFGPGETHLYFEVAKLCPELHALLQSTPALRELGGIRDDTASLRQLTDLRVMLADFARDDPATSAFDYEGLDALLEEILQSKEPQQPGFWDRALRRVLEWLDARVADGWLEKLSLPEAWSERLTNGALLLIILLAVVLVGNELRVAQVWRLLRPRSGPEAVGSAASVRTPSIDGLDALPPRRQIALLLEWVIWRLAQHGVVPLDGSYTNRELLLLLDGRLRERFAEFIDSAEGVLYGDRALPSDEVQRLKDLALNMGPREASGPNPASGVLAR